MGDILRKITELLENGGNYEQSRSTGIILNSKITWFEGVCSEDYGQPITEPNKVQANGAGDTKERISKTCV